MENKPAPRLYAIEFLRIFLAFCVILLWHGVHFNDFISFKKGLHTYFAVEFFFIIGGFFLYDRLCKSGSVVDIVKRLYTRLAPGLIFVFLLCVILGIGNIWSFPSILTLTTGMNIPGEITGWGDWYVGCYFWVSCLFIALFKYCGNKAFMWTCILMYFSLCLTFNYGVVAWNGTYYKMVSVLLCRAIYSMGCGILAGFISKNISFRNTKFVRLCFTFIEIVCLVSAYRYLFHFSRVKIKFFQEEILFSILLISISHSWGYSLSVTLPA